MCVVCTRARVWYIGFPIISNLRERERETETFVTWRIIYLREFNREQTEERHRLVRTLKLKDYQQHKEERTVGNR